jgi:internalin A
LARSLEELSIQAYQDAEVDLTQLPKLTSLAGPWSVFRSTFAGSERLKRLITWAFDESDMRVLRNTFTLEDVTIKDAPHVESLTGIGDLPALEALRVIVARSLRDIRDVARLAGSLRELIFEGCPGVGDLEPLRSLVRLRVLGVSDCGYIESLGPIRPLNQLEQFSGWGSTRVVDGDLSPLAALPLLSEVRMRDRKGYSPHVRDLASAVF